MKRAFTLIELLITVVIVLVLAAILLPLFARREPPRHSICQNNLKNIGLGFQQYLRDYDERFPRVSSEAKDTFGWVDAVSPYIKSTQIYECPTEGNQNQAENPRANLLTDYWYNARLSGLEQTKLQASAWTIIHGDGNDGTDSTNARYALSSLSNAWRNDKKSPLYRHLEGAYYGFVDGHVKWYKPDQIQNDVTARKGLPTFSWK